MQNIKQFIQFSLVGASGTLINIALFNGLLFLSWFHQYFLIANLIAFVCAASHNFYWNQRWTFQQQADHKSVSHKYLQFFVVSSVVLILNTIIMASCVHLFHIHRRVANLIAIALCLGFNYLGNAWWTFRQQ